MTPWTLTWLLALALAAGLFGFAFVIAPRSCEGGLAAYLVAGVLVLLAELALPFVLDGQAPLSRRVLASLGFGLLAAAAWVGGLFAANVRILCRLW